MEFNQTLESSILYLAYSKTILKELAKNLRGLENLGIFSESEIVLSESIQIGFDRLDKELENIIAECVDRSDKTEHLLLSLNDTMKGKKNDPAN